MPMDVNIKLESIDKKINLPDGRVKAAWENQKSLYGAAWTTTSYKSTTQKNRNLNTVASAAFAEATNTITFTAIDNVTEIDIICSTITGKALEDDSTVLVIYDGLNEATETLLFADTGGMAVDVEYERISANEITHRNFKSYIGRISFLPVVGMKISVSGV